MSEHAKNYGLYVTLDIAGKWHAFNRDDAAAYWSTDGTGIKLVEADTPQKALAKYRKGDFKFA